MLHLVIKQVIMSNGGQKRGTDFKETQRGI